MAAVLGEVLWETEPDLHCVGDLVSETLVVRDMLPSAEAEKLPLLEVLGERLTDSVPEEHLEGEPVELGERVLLEQSEGVGELDCEESNEALGDSEGVRLTE